MGTRDDLCCPDPDVMLGRHCVPVCLKWCFPLSCYPPCGRQTLSCFFGKFERYFPALLQRQETTIDKGISSRSRTYTHPPRSPHTKLEFIFLLLYTHSCWFLPVPWGNGICCPFPHNLEIVYMNEIVPNLPHENLVEIHGA